MQEQYKNLPDDPANRRGRKELEKRPRHASPRRSGTMNPSPALQTTRNNPNRIELQPGSIEAFQARHQFFLNDHIRDLQENGVLSKIIGGLGGATLIVGGITAGSGVAIGNPLQAGIGGLVMLGGVGMLELAKRMEERENK